MSQPETDTAREFFARTGALFQRAAGDRGLAQSIEAIAQAIASAFRGGNKVLLAGNGGSAADAQHIAAEFLSRFVLDRAPLPAIALTTDTSVLTAIGNDFGFEQVFARQVRGLGRKGDVFIAISTSGRSPNVLAAIAAAREMGVIVVGFGGAGGDMHKHCDIYLAVPSSETALIQQMHITVAHILCDMIEHRLFTPDGALRTEP